MYNIGLNYEHVPVSANETGLTILETLKKFKMYGVTTLDVHVDRLLSGDDTFKNILLSGLNVGSVFFKGDFGHDENIGYALSVVDYCAENNVNQIMLLTNELLDGDTLETYEIDKTSNLFHYLTRIQDEVHRYTINYHRTLRSKGSIASVLDNIEGIGAVRKKELIKKFGSVKKMSEASIEELTEIVPENIAISLKKYLTEFTNKDIEDNK